MSEFAHEFVDEFFANFVHEFKYEIRTNSIRMKFLREKLVMLRIACTVKLLYVQLLDSPNDIYCDSQSPH